MAATPSSKVSNKAVLTEYFETHGADVKAWPKGWKQAIAERTGGTVNAIGATRSRMAKAWPTKPTDHPHLKVVPDPPKRAAAEPAAGGSELTGDKTKAQRRSGPRRQAPGRHHHVRTAEELPEGFSTGVATPKVVPGHLIPWTCASSRTVVNCSQKRPQSTKRAAMKYLFPKGCGVVGVIAGSEKTVLDPSVPLLVVEAPSRAELWQRRSGKRERLCRSVAATAG